MFAHRFKAVTRFEFFQLFCYDRYSAYNSQFPNHLMTKLRDIYGGIFYYNRLKSELEVAHTHFLNFPKNRFTMFMNTLAKTIDICFQTNF